MPPKSTPAPAPSPAPVIVPGAVRALRSFRTRRADGRVWDVGVRDVYGGEDAAYLLERHAAHFESWPMGAS